MNNPFIYNSPVLNDDFFNREQIVKNILTEVVNGKTQGDVWVTGERKVGKTSLLRYIFAHNKNLVNKEIEVYGAEKMFTPIFALANVQYCRTENEFYTELWQSIKQILDIKLYVPDQPESNFTNAIKNALENNFFLVICIDEFDAFLETLAMENKKLIRNFINKFNTYLTSFQNYNHKAFCCIFSSNQDFIDINTKYDLQITGSGIIAQTFDLEWFSKDYVRQLASKYLNDNHVVFTKNELENLYKYTNGYPYFTQRILFLMYEYKNDKNIKEIDELIIQKFAETEFEQTIKFWIGQNLPKRTYDKLYSFLENAGKGIFDTALKILIEYSKSKF